MLKRTTAAAITAASLATLVFAAPSANAADPRTQFTKLEYGASYAVGYLRWHARSVDVDYSLKASYCRRLVVDAYNANSQFLGTGKSPLFCNYTDTKTVNVPSNQVGGAAYVRTYLLDENNIILDQDIEFRP
ncbi:hypothetical protein ACIA8G_05295 [Lentzea sp. NPDC051213]|uniref:hypothetical protein n=1 Tax=Lentzea sp. NPDC051213 TaxID=3364126 RepID=UPI0037A4FFB4